jgi:SAM-dependent methyltransferase
LTPSGSHTTPAHGPPLQACPLCGARERRPLLVKDGWPVAGCASCGLVYVDAAVDRSRLEEFYGSSYYEGDTFTDYVGDRDVRVASARGRVAELTRRHPGGRLLDVGCAAGFFLEAASEHYDVAGVELSAWAADIARERLGDLVVTGELADAGFPDDEFDVVTMWDVVEHLSHPVEVMAETARITRPGGLLALTTGTVEGPIARRDLASWSLMAPPGHLAYFAPSTIERLLNGAGFEVSRIHFDGHVSSRPALQARSVRLVAGALGRGNVMTVFATKVDQPRPRRLRALLPELSRR